MTMQPLGDALPDTRELRTVCCQHIVGDKDGKPILCGKEFQTYFNRRFCDGCLPAEIEDAKAKGLLEPDPTHLQDIPDDDMIDFACSPTVLAAYRELGLTNRGSTEPVVITPEPPILPEQYSDEVLDRIENRLQGAWQRIRELQGQVKYILELIERKQRRQAPTKDRGHT